MSKIITCDHREGSVVVPIEEKFNEIFRYGDTMLNDIRQNSDRIVRKVIQLSCACMKKNGEDHTCPMGAAGCDQLIILIVGGKKKRFAGSLFRRVIVESSLEQ